MTVQDTVVGDPPATGPTPRRLGRALHYRLGDGSRAEEGWGRLRELLGRVRKP
ncbi:hypothetical protein [Streptomyces sp. NPDC000983]|uniref:hypothetical protein n=1 Tax=Streptomyces sp. NPDC000983 TaxID=3154373 RepID=UPI0033300E88